MTRKKILLATDLSCRCDRALDRAALLASTWHASLTVVHALEESPSVTDLPSWRQTLTPAQLALQQIRADMPKAPDVHVDMVVEQGDPASVLLGAIERLEPDLVVTGVARGETLGRMLLGTTVEQIVRKSRVPLLVVKSRPHDAYRNVMLTSDYSESSQRALPTALPLLPASAKISLFHAYDVLFEGHIDDRISARDAAHHRATDEGLAFVANLRANAGTGHAIPLICEYGDPGVLLSDLTHTRGLDLVVLGTAGRTGLLGALLGSVALRLLATLPSDVLIVRPTTG
ncbi:universal stress protein [Polyangium mundeleinium]|uniref:Universal stress protein n=1 Tax=Polyangium mundeleinium TaxID=2995306 RepID=A0ABT5F777_9BACT|nr:universal stress protein [Polyangium mundeleinium]MDC0748945.1 universal stress protein [Polyangium mundeleinium]